MVVLSVSECQASEIHGEAQALAISKSVAFSLDSSLRESTNVAEFLGCVWVSSLTYSSTKAPGSSFPKSETVVSSWITETYISPVSTQVYGQQFALLKGA